jgi:hypothetical protein
MGHPIGHTKMQMNDVGHELSMVECLHQQPIDLNIDEFQPMASWDHD